MGKVVPFYTWCFTLKCISEGIPSVYLMNLCLGSSVWMNPINVGLSQNHESHLNQTNATNFAYLSGPTAASNQGAHCENASSSQIPTVSFDLGNEWDDWGDFDDENLVHACETHSKALCTINANPQVQQSLDYNMPGTVFLSFSQFKRYKLAINVWIARFLYI